MDYIAIIKDSIETSITMGFFKSIKDSTNAHIYKSKLVNFPLSKFNNVDNFNSNRLQNSAVKAYPINDRPRGKADISSVKFYQKQLQQSKNIQPIWILQINKKYVLLDGAHRIVASYIESIASIPAYIIKL
jgi:hypothetical protein